MENLLKFVQNSREVKWNTMNTDELEEGSKNQVKYVRELNLMTTFHLAIRLKIFINALSGVRLTCLRIKSARTSSTRSL